MIEYYWKFFSFHSQLPLLQRDTGDAIFSKSLSYFFSLQLLQWNKNVHQDPFSKQTPPLAPHSCEVMKLTVPSIYFLVNIIPFIFVRVHPAN